MGFMGFMGGSSSIIVRRSGVSESFGFIFRGALRLYRRHVGGTGVTAHT